MEAQLWQGLAQRQSGLITIGQLNSLGVSRSAVRHRLRTGRWVQRTSHVVSTTTGPLSCEQSLWLGVLHVGNGALIGGIHACVRQGLEHWEREQITVLVPHDWAFAPLKGYRFFRTRRSLELLRANQQILPTARLESAALLWASYEPARRTAHGLLAALVQQRLTTPDRLLNEIESLHPLRRAKEFKRLLAGVASGAHSMAELDVIRLCKDFGLPLPMQQTKRHDSSGQIRFTDAEWKLDDGRVLVLEVDGAFHHRLEHYADDVRRQRQLQAADHRVVVVRCLAIELRENPGAIARDLIAIGLRPSRLGA
ncbi:MAG TPA: type IV toxin-antitoxin system AbiEi family antitoxin domain-containing protein [Marmoricola sp.]|nr:type IV toxin-antitoxin system AbiEi family antitoxin domain-containing protein [Marmoricola sp.]